MATWGDQICQRFEATAVGFETGFSRLSLLTGIPSCPTIMQQVKSKRKCRRSENKNTGVNQRGKGKKKINIRVDQRHCLREK